MYTILRLKQLHKNLAAKLKTEVFLFLIPYHLRWRSRSLELVLKCRVFQWLWQCYHKKGVGTASNVRFKLLWWKQDTKVPTKSVWDSSDHCVPGAYRFSAWITENFVRRLAFLRSHDLGWRSRPFKPSSSHSLISSLKETGPYTAKPKPIFKALVFWGTWPLKH